MNFAATLTSLGVSLESIPVNIPAEVPVVVDQPDALEDSVAEVRELATTVDTLDSDLGQVLNADERLDRIAGALECFNDGRGLTQTDYATFRAAVEATVVGLGIEQSTVSVENFAGATARQAALNVAMEDVKDKLITVKKWAVEIIQAFVKWLGDFWKRLFDSLPKLKARAEAIKAKADGISGRFTGSITIPATAAANLSLKQTVDRDLLGASSRLVTTISAEIDKLSPTQVEAARNLSDDLKQAAKDLSENPEKVEGEDRDKVLADVFESLVGNYKKITSLRWTLDGDRVLSDEVLGGYGYELNVKSRSLKFSRLFPVHEGETEYPALKPSQVISLCDNILDLVSVLEKARAQVDARMAEAKDVQDALVSMTTNVTGGVMDSIGKHYVTRMRANAKAQTVILQGTLKALSQYSVSAATSMLQVADLSLKAVEQTDTKALPA